MVSAFFASKTLAMFQKMRSHVTNPGNSTLRSFCRFSSEFKADQRRSANYHPTIWKPERIESFDTPYTYKLYGAKLEELKLITRSLFKTTTDHRALLRLIDSTERLGVAYHFEDEIREAVSLVYQDERITDLHMTALRFRVLREHGLSVSTGAFSECYGLRFLTNAFRQDNKLNHGIYVGEAEVFNRFRGDNGRFLDSLSNDAELEGILSLYEASYLGMPGEDILEEAKYFSLKQLRCSSNWLMMKCHLAKNIEQSLEVPLYWRMRRIEARNFIDIYQLDQAKSPSLLELAKLDYNLVQSVYQTELKELARWWRDLGFKQNLDFARDRLMENYLWVMGIIYEPHLSKCRICVTKFVCILTAIDDVYDVYGSLDELECFTTAVERWDTEAMVDLPLYMKICYLAMFNFGNEVINDVLKNHGLDVSSYIKQAWSDLCRSYLVEARWFYSGHTTSLDEYLQNACTSVAGPSGIAHACVLMLGSSISKTSLDSCFSNGSELIRLSSLITRLNDDLGTSKDESERGDVAKAVECDMKETGVSEEEARTRVKQLRSHTWKMMNKEIMMNNNSLPKAMVRVCLNMARTSQCIFQHGDGIGRSTGITRDRLVSLIVKPVPL